MKLMGFGVYNLKNSRRHSLAEVLDHLKVMCFNPKTVIDIGVAYGTNDLYEKFPTAFHLLIEPLEEYRGVLEAISKKYNAQYELAAAGAYIGSIEINVHPDLSGSSLFKETEDSNVNGVNRKVGMITVDDACYRRNLSGPYLIKIDTQGAELLALEGSKNTLVETEAVILEVSLFQFFQGGPQFFDVITWMKNHGFVTYDLFGGHNRHLDGALAQIDIIFVKENGFLRKDHAYATREQREKLTALISADNPKINS
jgi:FkbM family methyltransferase